MTAAILFSALLGLGAIAVLTSQPHGAPKPSFASRLAALRPDAAPSPSVVRERVFRTAFFEDLLRPSIESIGRLLSRSLARVGLNPAVTAERLRITGDKGGLTLFLGGKLASGLVGIAILPLAASLGLGPRLPIFMWLVAGTAGFLMPDFILRSRAQTMRVAMREQLVQLAEMLNLAVSAGTGLEGALEQVIQQRESRLFSEVRRLLREGQINGESAAAALSRLPDDLALPEAEPLTTAIFTASTQGAPITQALRAQTRALRERRRLELVEAGERAQIKMLLPVGMLILPAFFVVVLYPAAVQLLHVTGL